MPAVMSRGEFDRRTLPLHLNLLLLAEKSVGPNDAPDVVQETLLTAWQDIAKFNAANDDFAFLAWLHAILAYECNRLLRSDAYKRETSLPAHVIFELCDGPDTPHWEAGGWTQQRAELYRRVHSATLTPQQRDCTLRWLGGESLQAIGATQPVPISKVAVHYIVRDVGKLLAQVDDADTLDRGTEECLRNMPAALSYAGQEMLWKRVRREANEYALRHTAGRSYRHAGGRS